VTGEKRGASAYWAPVVAAIGLFCLLNLLWVLPSLELYDKFPHSLGVYLPTSLLCLAMLWWAGRTGLLTRNEAGLCLAGWKPWKRLLALAVTLILALGGYFALPPPQNAASDLATAQAAADGAAVDEGSDTSTNAAAAGEPSAAVMAKKPSWGDYCFWFVFLLAASVVELLVFASIGFCLPEKYLRSRGYGPFPAAAMAALFAAITFGLYHYTHEPRWWQYAIIPLVPVMLVNLSVFALTRNFWLTMLLHNAFAAVGFTGEQWTESLKESPSISQSPATYLNPEDPSLAYIVAAFVVPFLVLHVVEAWAFRKDPA